MTPLKGADGQVYAVAQGNLVVNGLSATGRDGSNVTVNSPSVGRFQMARRLNEPSIRLFRKATR